MTFHLWTTASYKAIANAGAGTTEHQDVAFSKKGDVAVVSAYTSLHAFGSTDGKPLWSLELEIDRDTVIRAQSLVATADGALRAFGRAETGAGPLGAALVQYDVATGKPRPLARCAKSAPVR